MGDAFGSLWCLVATIEHEWYEKHPDSVTEQEFQHLAEPFNHCTHASQLASFGSFSPPESPFLVCPPRAITGGEGGGSVAV
jgi:hypothetical protein